MAYFNQRYHPPSTAPGTLTADDTTPTRPLNLRLLRYDAVALSEREGISPAACTASLANGTITGIHTYGHASPDLLREWGGKPSACIRWRWRMSSTPASTPNWKTTSISCSR